MSEYGRGLGSEPWHPEDPLYGDQGWNGPQPADGSPGQYGGQPHSYQPQWDGQAAPYGATQQQYGQQQYGQQGYGQQGYGQQQYGWDPSQTTATAYGHQPTDPYGTPGLYPPPPPHQPPGSPPAQQQYAAAAQTYDPQQRYPEPQQYQQPDAGPPGEWSEEREADDHRFFTGNRRHDDDEDGEDEPHGARPGRRDKRSRPKRRSGTACLLVGVVLVGVVGGVGYLGYAFWQDHFGPPPDFTSSGSGEVQVEIPDGATGNQMGSILKEAGVVKSVDAFVEAQNNSPKSQGIQPGVYVLRKGMSAEAAVEMMTDPKNINGLIIAEGLRASAVYAAIDKKLDLAEGTTKTVAKDQAENLGLPGWADDNPKIKDPLEGFLYPSRYSVAKGTKPEEVLRQMVDRAKQEYAKLDVAGQAKKLGLESPLQVVTVASLVQAEGKTHDDFRKMADVVYNRMDPGNEQTWGKIEFDSTYNYLKNQSNINIPLKAIRNDDDPYNTYFYRGLPPGPIGNPGLDALEATFDPDEGGWFYFVSVDGDKTEFTKSYEEHLRLVEEFNKNQQQKGQ